VDCGNGDGDVKFFLDGMWIKYWDRVGMVKNPWNRVRWGWHEDSLFYRVTVLTNMLECGGPISPNVVLPRSTSMPG